MTKRPRRDGAHLRSTEGKSGDNDERRRGANFGIRPSTQLRNLDHHNFEMTNDVESLTVSALLKIRASSDQQDCGEEKKPRRSDTGIVLNTGNNSLTEPIQTTPLQKTTVPMKKRFTRKEQPTTPCRSNIPRPGTSFLPDVSPNVVRNNNNIYPRGEFLYPLNTPPRATEKASQGSFVVNKDPSKVNAPNNVPVRQEEVEAALRSKPQRGRKRDNLNEFERMELTRTRNREHAKTTRLRKKQRQEELEKSEAMLVEYSRKEELLQSRRQTLVQFLNVRQQVWRNRLADIQERVIAPEGLLSQQFCFQVATESDEGVHETDMEKFDESIACMILSRLTKSGSSPVSFELRYSVDDIAFSKHNSGFMEVDLVINGREIVTSACIKFHFLEETSKLSNFLWRTYGTYTEQDRDGLNVQISHPSVVSLDPLI